MNPEISPVAYLLKWLVVLVLGVGALVSADSIYRWFTRINREARRRAREEQQ